MAGRSVNVIQYRSGCLGQRKYIYFSWLLEDNLVCITPGYY